MCGVKIVSTTYTYSIVLCYFLGLNCFIMCAHNPKIEFALAITWEVELLCTNSDLSRLEKKLKTVFH